MRSPRARANRMLHGCHADINVQQYATRPNSKLNHEAQDRKTPTLSQCRLLINFANDYFYFIKQYYYRPITDTTLELSVFWPSDTESRINELRFSESISLSFKTRLTSVTCFCGDVT